MNRPQNDTIDSEYTESESDHASTLRLNDFFERNGDSDLLDDNRDDPNISVARWITVNRLESRRISPEQFPDSHLYEEVEEDEVPTKKHRSSTNEVVEETPDSNSLLRAKRVGARVHPIVLDSEDSEDDEINESTKSDLNSERSSIVKETPTNVTENVMESQPAASSDSFVTALNNADNEIKRFSSNWRKGGGIYHHDNTIPTESQSFEDQWMEIYSLFQSSCSIGSSVTFENNFMVNWKLYDKNLMQYVVWTKLCNEHDENELVEMKKEANNCELCDMNARLTVPLCLDEVPIPINETMNVFVSFLATKLPEGSKNPLFTEEVVGRMFNIGNRMSSSANILQISQKQYEKWYCDVKNFTKKSLMNRSINLSSGRVIRRKFHEEDCFKRSQCFIFADIFDIV